MAIKSFCRLLFTALQCTAIVVPVAASDPVPPQYAGLYAQLQTSLDAFERTLDALPPSPPAQVTYATELLAANCNRGEALLQPTTMSTVRLSLDRFQEMGITGVTVALHYPLFDPAFPRREEYEAFYRAVALEVHSRGMVLDVENNTVFTGTPFSPIQWDWTHYTVASLAAARNAMAQVVLDEVQPDYLDVGTESDTEASLTGIVSLKDPQVFATFIHGIVSGLNRGNTRLCAGMGAWDDMEQGRLLAQDPALDVLAFHFYPLNAASLQNVLLMGDLARANGKPLILDETWLYKEPPSGGIVSSTDPYRRNAYSFWAALDQQHLRCITKLVQSEGVVFASPFNSTYFFAYVPYDPSLDAMPFADAMAIVTRAESAALHAGTRTSTGDYYAALITRSPVELSADFTTSPALPTDAAPVVFSASASGGTAPYTFTWDLDGAPAAGETASKSFPAGAHQVTLTVKDAAGGTAQESKTITVVAAPRIASVSKLANPFRLKIAGSNFQSDCAVTINGEAVPQTDGKGSTLVYAKQGGALKAMLPKGVTVQVAVVNPDGTSSSPFPFTR